MHPAEGHRTSEPTGARRPQKSRMASPANGQDRNDEPEPTPPAPPDPLEATWRIVRPALEIGCLYAVFRQHEGTALCMQCLVIVVQSYLDIRRG